MKTIIETQFNDTQFEVSLRSVDGSGYITAIIRKDWDDEDDESGTWYSVSIVAGHSFDMSEECSAHTSANMPGKFKSEGEAIRAMTKRIWASKQRLAGKEPNFIAPEIYKFTEKVN